MRQDHRQQARTAEHDGRECVSEQTKLMTETRILRIQFIVLGPDAHIKRPIDIRQTKESSEGRIHDEDKEDFEISAISTLDARVGEGAMMVNLRYAALADYAVEGPHWSNNVANPTQLGKWKANFDKLPWRCGL